MNEERVNLMRCRINHAFIYSPSDTSVALCLDDGYKLHHSSEESSQTHGFRLGPDNQCSPQLRHGTFTMTGTYP